MEIVPDAVATAPAGALPPGAKPGAAEADTGHVDPTRVRVTGPDGKPLAGRISGGDGLPRPGLALVEVHATGFVHPGVPVEMQRWGDLLKKELDDRCSAQVSENEDVRLDVALEKRAPIPR